MKRLAKKIDLSKLTKAQARVEIAKDVIAGIKADKFRATHTYADLDLMGDVGERAREVYDKLTETWDGEEQSYSKKVDWMAVLNLPKASCDVCAIGACFAATVRRENKFSAPTTSVEREDVVKRMRNYFSPGQLDKLESAYESGYAEWTEEDDRFAGFDACGGWRKFGRDLGYEDNERMTNLMLHIVAMKGEIVLPKSAKK